jgi:poly(beta-D-mannuronate) lyase
MSYRLRILVAALALLAACAACAAPVRDVIAGFLTYPFLTDAEVLLYRTDTTATLSCSGAPVTVRYPGVCGLTVDGQPAPILKAAPDLVQVQVPAGVHEVALVLGPTQPVGSFEPVPGAVSTPAELTAALQTAGPGSEVVIRDGVYDSWQVKIQKSGSADRPLVIRPETPGGVIFLRATYLRIAANAVVLRGFQFENCGPFTALTVAGDDNRVTGCRFSFCGNPTSTFDRIVLIEMGANRNRVDHCSFVGSKCMSTAQRISATGEVGLDNRFDHNIYRDIFRYWVNGQENIQIGQDQRNQGDKSPRCTTEYNLFDNAWGDSEIVSNKSSGNTHRHNLAAYCTYSAFTLRGGDDVRVDGNVFFRCGDGIRVIGKRHTVVNNLVVESRGDGIIFETGMPDNSYVATEGSLIANNTIVNCASAGIRAQKPTDTRPFAAKDVTVANNLVVGRQGTLLDLPAVADLKARRNLVWATGAAKAGVSDGDAIAQDPLLQGAGLSLTPSATSPAVDQAEPLAAVQWDRRGLPRPAGAGPDIGADEVGATGQAVQLPDLPAPPLLMPELYRGAPVSMWSPTAPADAFATDGASTAQDQVLTLTDATARLKASVPADLCLQWDYQPETFSSRATLELGSPGGPTYRLTWGDVNQDGKPLGIVSLFRAETPAADAADLTYYSQDFRYQGWMNTTLYTSPDPDPKRWYQFTLLKQGPHLWLLMAGRNGMALPVMFWTDRNAAGPLAVSQLRLRQDGTGRWRGLNLWTFGDGALKPPASPRDLGATPVGGSQIALTWRPGGTGAAAWTYRIYRSPAPGFTPSEDNLIAAGVPGSTWRDFGLQPATLYCYQVQAQNAAGEVSGFAVCEARTTTGGPWSALVAADRPARLVPPLDLGVDPTTGEGFVWGAGMPNSMTTPPTEGVAEYPVTIPRAGAYALWGRVSAPNESSDSYWVSLDSYQNGDWHLWYTGAGPGWRWSPIDRNASLQAGPQTLRLTYRESNCKLSDVLITDDLTLDPGAGAP